MSTTIADPLFVRAELAYRQETWGVTDHHDGGASPALATRLRRVVASLRNARPRRTVGAPRPVHPRHP